MDDDELDFSNYNQDGIIDDLLVNAGFEDDQESGGDSEEDENDPIFPNVQQVVYTKMPAAQPTTSGRKRDRPSKAGTQLKIHTSSQILRRSKRTKI
jgi:hypothetical protein